MRHSACPHLSTRSRHRETVAVSEFSRCVPNKLITKRIHVAGVGEGVWSAVQLCHLTSTGGLYNDDVGAASRHPATRDDAGNELKDRAAEALEAAVTVHVPQLDVEHCTRLLVGHSVSIRSRERTQPRLCATRRGS